MLGTLAIVAIGVYLVWLTWSVLYLISPLIDKLTNKCPI